MRRGRNHLGKVFLRAMDCFLQLFSTFSSILHSTLDLSSISRLSMLLKMAFSSSVKLSATVSTLRLLVLVSSIFYYSAKESLLARAISSLGSSFFLFFFFLFFFFFFFPDSSGSFSPFSVSSTLDFSQYPSIQMSGCPQPFAICCNASELLIRIALYSSNKLILLLNLSGSSALMVNDVTLASRVVPELRTIFVVDIFKPSTGDSLAFEACLINSGSLFFFLAFYSLMGYLIGCLASTGTFGFYYLIGLLWLVDFGFYLTSFLMSFAG